MASDNFVVLLQNYETAAPLHVSALEVLKIAIRLFQVHCFTVLPINVVNQLDHKVGVIVGHGAKSALRWFHGWLHFFARLKIIRISWDNS